MKNSELTQTRAVRILAVTCLILLIPLVATRLSSDVNWEPNDFVVAGLLLFVAGMVLNLILRKIRNKNRKFMAIGILALAFLYIWAELAVGIFTNWGS